MTPPRTQHRQMFTRGLLPGTRLIRLFVAMSMAVPLVVAAQSTVPRYEVRRASAPVTVDGRLDEAAWAAAPAVTLQFLWESQTGAKQMTRARLLWDAQALNQTP